MPRHRSLQILAFMTPFPYSIDVEAPLAEAHAFLRERQIRHLPVTERGQPGEPEVNFPDRREPGARVQPVPCVWRVSMRGARQMI